MLGHWGAGKTSLVSRYVNQVFDEQYQATIGVKMDTKEVIVGEQNIKMVLWDIAGSENNFNMPMHFVSGAAGFILVVDGTSRDSFEHGLELLKLIHSELGKLPFVIAINKNDLKWHFESSEIESYFNLDDLALDNIDLHDIDLQDMEKVEWLSTSAKTGENVESTFLTLAKKIA